MGVRCVRLPLYVAFTNHVSPVEATGCWQWNGDVDSRGYGRVRRRYKTPMPSIIAHRLSYILFVGPIPSGLTIDHLCRNRLCVNPAHLEPVTRGENVLRGVGLSAMNARKTTCHRGHTLVRESGARRCRTCANAQRRAKNNGVPVVYPPPQTGAANPATKEAPVVRETQRA